jgi:hypothetical protein
MTTTTQAPQPKQRVTLRLPAELVEEARHAAISLHVRSVNDVVADALREFLNRHRQDGEGGGWIDCERRETLRAIAAASDGR